ncbi:MAG TPA: PLP-dependent aminotransferase family protein [Chloroflexota bacterium]
MQIRIDRDADVPIYRQIVDQVAEQIRTGALPAASRLPPIRRVAVELGITRLTVHSAYSELQAQGLVESHVGRGTFVASQKSRAIARLSESAHHPEWVADGFIANLLQAGGQEDIVSFAQAFPAPETIPVRDLRRAVQLAMRRPASFDYGPIQGHAELREHIAAVLLDRGVSTAAQRILITAGAQQAIDVILRTCTEPGDAIAVEAPTYPGVLELADLRHLRVLGVPSDDGGIRVDALEAMCATHRPRLLYLVPTCGNPTGRTLVQDRRASILSLARTHDMLIIEDDIYGLLAFDPPAPPALKSDDQDDVVLYLTSFSKMLAPALRTGALLAPVSLLPRLAAAKGSTDLVCSSLLQLALNEYLRQGYLLPHLDMVRDVYRERCAAMRTAIERYLPSCTASEPEGGLSIWLRLPDGVNESDFAADALDVGVAVVPGQAFFPDVQHGSFIRLGFGMQSPERIERGIPALGQVLQAHVRRGPPRPSLARGTASPLV